jgi:hypothetical protein
VLQQTENRYWHIPASDGEEWLCMGDSTLTDAVYDEGQEEKDQSVQQGNSGSGTSGMTDLESDPGADEELDAFGRAGPRTTVTISRRNKPKTTNVITDHSVPSTASAARADMQQKKFRSILTLPTGQSKRTFTLKRKKSAVSSKFSSKYIEDGS